MTLVWNGINPPVYWDGTATGFQNCSFTQDSASGAMVNFTPSSLTMGCLYANRLFMPEADSLRVWYPSAAEAYKGACQYLDLSPYVTKGGDVTEVCTWTYTSLTGGVYQVLRVHNVRGRGCHL